VKPQRPHHEQETPQQTIIGPIRRVYKHDEDRKWGDGIPQEERLYDWCKRQRRRHKPKNNHKSAPKTYTRDKKQRPQKHQTSNKHPNQPRPRPNKPQQRKNHNKKKEKGRLIPHHTTHYLIDISQVSVLIT